MTYVPVHLPAVRRDPMPPRTCEGYAGRSCSTPLSRYNQDVICAVCARRRSDAIVAAGNARRAAS